jgi:hypothetical protein
LGGDDLVKATFTDGTSETLSAGDGAIFALATSFAVLMGKTHSLWLGVELGVKTTSVGDGQNELSLTRFPLIPRASWILGPQSATQVVFTAGMPYEAGVHTSGDGIASSLTTSFEDALGWMGEFSILWRSPGIAIDLAARYTNIRYVSTALTGSIDASSFGVLVGFHFPLATEPVGP